MNSYPKRLIEVDLPIKLISAHARREKAGRQTGHISALHIWWARRPLVACRAVTLAALLPDPVDTLCPVEFKNAAKSLLKELRDKRGGKKRNLNDLYELRQALLDFISDYSDWENSNNDDFNTVSRNLINVAHASMFNIKDTHPLVLDPFCGGGAIPFEALRIGADVYASDLNPIPVLINKILVEYLPKYGISLATGLRQWGKWASEIAKKELVKFYPKGADGGSPFAYLWARVINCEGPKCGAEVPLIQSLWLAQKGKNSVAVRFKTDSRKKEIEFEIIENAKAKDVKDGTVRRGAVTCPICGYTTPVNRIRDQLRLKKGGSSNARLYAIVAINSSGKKYYRLTNKEDLSAYKKAEILYNEEKKNNPLSFPDEKLPSSASGYFAPPTYGAKSFEDLFNKRQLVAANWLINSFERWCSSEKIDKNIIEPLRCCISLAIDRLIDSNSSQCWWVTIHGETVMRTFGRQSYPIIWDYAEINPIGSSSRGIDEAVEIIADCLEYNTNSKFGKNSMAFVSKAQNVPLPHDSCAAIITDPPYYNAIPYSDLADFYYVWLRRLFLNSKLDLFEEPLSAKEAEIVEMSSWDSVRYAHKTPKWYEEQMAQALNKGREILMPAGIMVIVFAHKDTKAWESLISAIITAGWIISASWPISSENIRRLRAQKSATLESSIYLVCRPRENSDGSLITNEIGDWRDVLAELPKRIHEWMPRLAEEGVVGADAIFACLGPALEIFSRYSKVEKASGEAVTLKEYLEQVWAVVAKEALNMIFEGADTSGFEEDARLTAMWLWTLSTGTTNGDMSSSEEENDEDDEGKSPKSKPSGYTLEYDAARIIAQGLGANLDHLQSLVEVKGDKARLLPVSERTKVLFGKDESESPVSRLKRKSSQMELGFMEEVEKAEQEGSWGQKKVPHLGNTMLDRIHQSMILFAANRSEALKRFLVEEGVGRNQKFWKLAQALSALYPSTSDEKRWVDGVLARKKGLGF